MTLPPRIRARLLGTATALTLLLTTAPAYAAGSSMPWEAPLQSILNSVEGPVAKIIAVIIIIITGLSLAFGDTSGGSRRVLDGSYRAWIDVNYADRVEIGASDARQSRKNEPELSRVRAHAWMSLSRERRNVRGVQHTPVVCTRS